jgi:co-chaperonin GroES (HSP10)
MGMNNELGFIPVGEKVLIETIVEKTTSGLILVRDTERKPTYGIVLAIGADVMDKGIVGKRVAFPDWVAQPVYVEQVKMFVMEYNELFGYFTNITEQ